MLHIKNKLCKVCIILMILSMPFVYHIMHYYNVFIDTAEENLSFNDAIVSNMSIENTTYSSTNHDPSILFELEDGILTQNLELEVLQINGTTNAKIYLDLGNGLNETDSVSFKMREGRNFIDLKKSVTIYNLRIDPTEQEGMSFVFGDITMNQSVFNIPYVWAVFNILLLFAAVHFRKYNVMFSLLTYLLLYCGYGFYYTSDNLLLNIVFFIILMIGVSFLSSLWREVGDEDV